MANFKEVELLFADLLAHEGSELSDSELNEIAEYVNVGEYGLALRTAVAIYAEEKKFATPAEKYLMRKLAIAMAIDPAPLLDRLEGK